MIRPLRFQKNRELNRRGAEAQRDDEIEGGRVGVPTTTWGINTS